MALNNPPYAVTGNYFNGYMASTASGWTTTSTTFATPTGGTNTLTTRNSNGITVTAAASNAPGITFTPSASTSIYQIGVSFTSYCTSSFSAYYRITDGTNVLWSGVNLGGVVGISMATPPLVYVPGTASAVTITIQTATINAADSAGIYNGSASPQVNAIEWSVMRIF